MESVRRIEVRELSTPPIVMPESTTITKVVGIFRNQNAYEAFIEEHDKVQMVMIRDLLKSSNVQTEKVGKLAYHVPMLTPRTTLEQVARSMMAYRLRALPVMDGGKLVGKVDEASIMHAIPKENLSKYRVKDIMTSNPITISYKDKVSKARTLMIRRKIDHLPVEYQSKLVGMLTSSQIIFNLFQQSSSPSGSMTMVAETQRTLEPPVESIMDSNPLTCSPSDMIEQVLQQMTDLGTTYSIVTLFDEIQGIVTYRDFMKLITETIVKEEIPITIIGLPDDPFEAEQTRSKFTRSVELLRKSFPFIEQSQAVIKTKDPSTRDRKRYEVKVSLITPKKNYIYTETGFELANIFDNVAQHLKSMMTNRSRRRRSSIRYTSQES